MNSLVSKKLFHNIEYVLFCEIQFHKILLHEISPDFQNKNFTCKRGLMWQCCRVALCYVLPVLWMTSRHFPCIMGPMARVMRAGISKWLTWGQDQIKGEVWYLLLPQCFNMRRACLKWDSINLTARENSRNFKSCCQPAIFKAKFPTKNICGKV